MTTRPLRADDIPYLQAMAEASGFPYPDAADTEVTLVVVDSENHPIMACGAKKLIELYLWVGMATPVTKLAGLRLLHTAMAEELRALGYSSAECFLPPKVEKQFGRRLTRSWGWVKNWASFNIHF